MGLINTTPFTYSNSTMPWLCGVKEENDKYTIASNKDIYFIDAYSHTYANEDRARIFESFCSTEDIFSKYPKLKKKAFYLKDEITRVYPSIKDSKLFNILN